MLWLITAFCMCQHRQIQLDLWAHVSWMSLTCQMNQSRENSQKRSTRIYQRLVWSSSCDGLSWRAQSNQWTWHGILSSICVMHKVWVPICSHTYSTQKPSSHSAWACPLLPQFCTSWSPPVRTLFSWHVLTHTYQNTSYCDPPPPVWGTWPLLLN